MRPREWLVPALTGIMGMAAGVWIAGGHSPTEDRESLLAAGRPTTPSEETSIDGSKTFTLDDVRRVVRQELDARAVQPAIAPATPSTPPDSPTPAQAMAATQARAVLDSAIARRTWTELDSEALRENFHDLSPDQRAELLQAYAMAVNQGRLVPQTDRVPF